MKTWRDMVKDLAGEGLLACIRYTFLVGILAHGMVMFNKLSWHGDLVHGFYLPMDKAISLGRWLKAFMNHGVGMLFSGRNLSLPLIFAAVSMLLIALSAHVILTLFDIRRKSLRIALCAMMVSFPVVASTFGFMFDAPYYFFALLLTVSAVYIAVNRPRWDGFVVAALCLCGCLSIYQTYFPVAVSLFVIRLIFEIAEKRHESLSKAILRGAYFLGICVVGLALFFVSWKVVMKLMGMTANNYQGTSSIGQSGPVAYLKGIYTAYRRFVLLFDSSMDDLYPMALAWVQRLIVVLSVVGGACVFVRRFREDKLQALLMGGLMALLPMCFNLIYVMAASSPSERVYVYHLMLYGQCMLYAFLICTVNFLLEGGAKKGLRRFCRAAVAALAVMVCLNVYLDNACYNKAQMEIQQTISDGTVMISRIKSVEGYTDELPVCFIMDGEMDATRTTNSGLRHIKIIPFNEIYPYHNRRDYTDFLRKWCAFKPDYVSPYEFKQLDEVQQMPSYPDDGSIKIIDGTVVVKW